MSESISSSPKISEELRKFLKIVLGDQIGGQMESFQRRNVAQLKRILGVLNRMPFVSHCGLLRLQLSLNRRKDQLISSICQLLYDDFPSCQRMRHDAEHDILLYAMFQDREREQQRQDQAEQQQQRHTTTAAPVIAATPPAPVAFLPPSNQRNGTPSSNPHAFMLNAYAQQFQNQPNSDIPSKHPIPAPFSPKPSPAKKKKSPARKKSIPNPATPSARPIPPAFLPSPAKMRSPALEKSSPKPKKVKSEPRSDDESSSTAPTQQSRASLHDSTPHNPREYALATELMAMGFSDRTEILWSVRKVARSGPLCELTCEDVMLDIITTREETDEARKMDEARRLSERTRKQESKRLRWIIAQNQAEERKKANWSEWSSRSDMYARSWILADAGARDKLEHRVNTNLQIKETLMEVLDLEKKARKWYGQTLPRAYFRGTLVQRFSSRIENDSSDQQILGIMKSEISMLKEAMFTLSDQQGGVPKLFVDALDSPTMVAGDDGEEIDEDIMVVRVDGGLGAQKGPSTPKSLRRQQFVQRTPDVIEIE